MTRTWRERLGLESQSAAPTFDIGAHPTLLQFGQLFLDSELFAFDADKRLRVDALSPLYDCETESIRAPGATPERFSVIWTPVWDETDPVTGFRTGQDSAYLGSTATVAMPQDERTAALLLLVTSAFVHLSARNAEDGPLIQGAIDEGADTFRFVQLAPGALSRTGGAAQRQARSDP